MTLERYTRVPSRTRILLAVFEHFRGLEFSDLTPGCVVGVFRVADLRPFSLLLGATLEPGWQTAPLYHRMARRAFWDVVPGQIGPRRPIGAPSS